MKRLLSGFAVVLSFIFCGFSFSGSLPEDSKINKKIDEVAQGYLDDKNYGSYVNKKGEHRLRSYYFSEFHMNVYQENKPEFPEEIAEFSDQFIQYLEFLGFFQYKRGGDGGFDIERWIRQLEEHANFYKELVTSKGVPALFFTETLSEGVEDKVKEYKKFGQVVNVYTVRRQFNLDYTMQ
ncbi:hypothetical protein [Candidatus Sororendozoicomonas aggregata]|uniref:hypothetical protein n=1 Tax=Candidatus Sororendozoicomonas aggregata TaxID=3073239 RepID=UPI002ED3A39E